MTNPAFIHYQFTPPQPIGCARAYSRWFTPFLHLNFCIFLQFSFYFRYPLHTSSCTGTDFTYAFCSWAYLLLRLVRPTQHFLSNCLKWWTWTHTKQATNRRINLLEISSPEFSHRFCAFASFIYSGILFTSSCMFQDMVLHICWRLQFRILSDLGLFFPLLSFQTFMNTLRNFLVLIQWFLETVHRPLRSDFRHIIPFILLFCFILLLLPLFWIRRSCLNQYFSFWIPMKSSMQNLSRLPKSFRVSVRHVSCWVYCISCCGASLRDFGCTFVKRSVCRSWCIWIRYLLLMMCFVR